ncbi:MAG: hypothetical protein ACYC4P_16040 [Thermoanaerobaculia bacterium]
MLLSLPVDFRVKTTGMGFGSVAAIAPLPVITRDFAHLAAVCGRTLLLSCVTEAFAPLWAESWDQSFSDDQWTRVDPRLLNTRFSTTSKSWSWSTPLRTDYERRQALVEIDVLASLALGLTLDELLTIYRIQFPVLQQNERETWYDQNGRIVFTCSKGLPGIGFDRAGWNEIKEMKSGTVTRMVLDDTLPGGPRERTITYVAPFDRCDREADYRLAWRAFEDRGEFR